jgi:hypothetical protein
MDDSSRRTDRDGETIDLTTLDMDERELVAELLRFAVSYPDARTGQY